MLFYGARLRIPVRNHNIAAYNIIPYSGKPPREKIIIKYSHLQKIFLVCHTQPQHSFMWSVQHSMKTFPTKCSLESFLRWKFPTIIYYDKCTCIIYPICIAYKWGWAYGLDLGDYHWKKGLAYRFYANNKNDLII